MSIPIKDLNDMFNTCFSKEKYTLRIVSTVQITGMYYEPEYFGTTIDENSQLSIHRMRDRDLYNIYVDNNLVVYNIPSEKDAKQILRFLRIKFAEHFSGMQ